MIDVVIEGKPHPLIRARSKAGQRPFDPPANVAAKRVIRDVVAWVGEPYVGPVRIEIVCEYQRKTPTADVDNLAKTCLDALNRYAIKDDRQVMELLVSKRGSCPEDLTRLRMFALTG